MHFSFNKTAKLFTASFITIAVLAGVYTYFFISMRNNVDKSVLGAAKIEDLAGKDERIDATLAILAKEALVMQKVSASFIKQSEIVNFTRTLESLGPQSHTELSIESLEPGVGDRGIPVLNFRIKAQGKFKDVVALIALLENFPARLDWNSARLVRIGTPATVPVLDSKGIAVQKAPSSIPLWSVEVSLTALNFIKE